MCVGSPVETPVRVWEAITCDHFTAMIRFMRRDINNKANKLREEVKVKVLTELEVGRSDSSLVMM